MVSVVIPTHKRAMQLQKAIDSVIEQTYSEWELFVVSDGFDQKTDDLMGQRYCQNEKIVYLTYPNSLGANHARNIGINSSRGEYIAFLDDDDIWRPEKLEKQVQVMERDRKIGLVYTGKQIIYWINRKKIDYYSSAKYQGDLSKKILFQNVIGTTSSVLVRKSLLEEEQFDEKLSAAQDYDLWIRLCQKTKVGAVDEPLLLYNNYVDKDREKQISASTDRYLEANEIIMKKYLLYFGELSRAELDRRHTYFERDIANNYFRNGKRKHARKIYRDLFFRKPNLYDFLLYFISYLNYKNCIRLRKLYR